MPVALLLIGALLVATGLRGTYPQLGALLAADFSGSGSFWYFVFGVIIIGSIGNIPDFREISRLLIALIVVVYMLSNRGFWAQLQATLQNIQTTPSAPVPKTSNTSPQVQKDGTTMVPNPNGTQSPVNVPDIWSGGML